MRESRRVAWLLLVVLCPTVTPVTARADQVDGHRVTYTVTATDAVVADIYLRETDPPSWADYSHDPYLYSPKFDAVMDAGQSWSRDVVLSDPQRWAMVSVIGRSSAASLGFHCELAVDGVVVARGEGARAHCVLYATGDPAAADRCHPLSGMGCCAPGSGHLRSAKATLRTPSPALRTLRQCITEGSRNAAR